MKRREKELPNPGACVEDIGMEDPNGHDEARCRVAPAGGTLRRLAFQQGSDHCPAQPGSRRLRARFQAHLGEAWRPAQDVPSNASRKSFVRSLTITPTFPSYHRLPFPRRFCASTELPQTPLGIR